MKSPRCESVLLAHGSFQRNRLLRDFQDLADLADRDVHLLGDFLRRRLAAELLDERARRANELIDRFDHVNRDTDGPRQVGNRPGDRLPDPPRGVGRELVAAAVLELVHGLHQADVAFLNPVEERQPAIRYFFAIETTRRRFASTSACLACSACRSPRMIVWSVRFNSSGAC